MPNFIPKKPKRDENGNIIFSSLKRKTPLKAKTPLRAKPKTEVKAKEVKKGKRQKSQRTLIKELDKVFSLFIRLRDSKPFGFKYFKCPTCGRVLPFEEADCSHYYSRVNMNTRYDEMNCHAECRYCMTPDTLVLTEDLRWVKLGDVLIGDKLFGFDEEVIYKTSRRYRVSTVTHTHREIQDVYEVELENGDKIKTTLHHKWLARVRNGMSYSWVETSQLRVNGVDVLGRRKSGPKGATQNNTSMVCKPFKVVQQSKTYEAGWIAGMIDADGHVVQQNIHNPDGSIRYGLRVGISQCNKYMDIVEDIVRIMYKFLDNKKPLRFSHETCNNSPLNRNYYAENFLISGTNVEKLQFLMRVRPNKIKKIDITKVGKLKSQYDTKVKSVRYVGKEEIVVMETDTHTFIANGYAMHNCNRFDSSHLIAYGEWMMQTYGPQKMALLKLKANTHKKWECWELEQLIKFYKARIEELKQDGTRLNQRF